MNLIDEIEAAANYSVANKAPFPPQLAAHFDAGNLVHSQFWPRIKAALESAQEMKEYLDIYGVIVGGHAAKVEIALQKFREAMNGAIK